MFLPVTLELLTGFWETLKIFFLTLLFSIPLGLVVCFGSMSRFQPLRWLTRGIIWVIRGTPLMLQLIVVFYGPGLMFGLPSITPAIFRRSTGAASSPSPKGSTRRARCWA